MGILDENKPIPDNCSVTIRIGVILKCAKHEEEDTAQSELAKR